MKATIDIPDSVLAETMENTHASSQEQGIVLALIEYNRRQRLARLADLLGRSETFMTIDELMALRQADTNRTY